MIEQWQPGNSVSIDTQLLKKLASEPHASGELKQDLLTATEYSQLKQWIQVPEAQWQTALAELSDPQLMAIAYWYVRAEEELSGWESGAKNPAIWVFRRLKQLQRRPDKETIRAIRALTRNRYIPNGKVL